MKKLLTLLSLLVVALSSFAQTFTVDGLEYTVLSEGDRTVQVSNGQNATGAVVIPETVTDDNGVEYSVTTIMYEAFYQNANITSIEMPSVTSIGGSAFSGCTSLSSVSLLAANTIDYGSFYDCSKISTLRIGSVEQWCNVNFGGWASNPLEYTSQSVNLYIGDSETPATEIVIPETVTNIPDYAFRKTTITSFYAPSASSIGSYAFYGCESLEEAILPKVETIGNDAFSGGRDYDDNEWHEHYCTSLKRVDLSSVKSIGSSAFYMCSNISSLRIGSVEQWYNVIFEGWYSCPLESTSQSVSLYIGVSETPATEIVVPENVKAIPDYAFRKTTITSFSAPGAETIGGSAFHDCTSLSSVSLPAATSIGSSAFAGCTSLSSVSLPVATSIGSSAFNFCTSLSSVSLPAATSIGIYAFSKCTSLSSLSLPAVTSIGSSAFSGCTPLSSVSLPSATSIGYEAFYRCSNISSLRIGSVEQWCNVNFEGNYSNPLPATSQTVDLYIGDSETPATEIVVPENVKTIPDYAFLNTTITSFSASGAETIGNSAFRNCTSLSSVSLPAATSIGSSAFYACESLEEAIMPKVETIGDDAFGGGSDYDDNDNEWHEHYCTSLKRVDLSSVKSIGSSAFYGCNSLDIVHLNDTPPTLAGTESFPTWTMLAVPDDAYETYLATEVFKEIPLQITKEGCLLKEVEVEAEPTTSKLLTEIGDKNARYIVNLKVKGTINSYDMMIIRNRMPSLRNLDLSEASIVDCDYEYYAGCHSEKDVIGSRWLSETNVMNVILPQTAKSMGSGAFENCKSLVSVSMPDGLTCIGSSAFYYCSNLHDIELPSKLTKIDEWAFCGCKNLTNIDFPSNLEYIGNCAFQDTGIKDIYIPSTLREMSYAVFNNLNSVRFESLEDWLNIQILNCSSSGGNYQTNWLGSPFENVANVYFGDETTPTETLVIPENINVIDLRFQGIQGIKEVVLHENVEEIGNSAFYDCRGLEKINFPESLKVIGPAAFVGSALKSVELPPYLTSIGEDAFKYCNNIEEILIPASIKEIGDGVFRNCDNLKRVIATTVEPISINQNTFSTYQTAKVYSPETSYYKYFWNTQWNQFLSIEEYGQEFAKTFGYKYFYLNGMNGDKPEDLTIDNSTGVIHGEKDETTGEEVAPDADFNEGAGVVVGGEQIQNLGDIHIHHNGNNGASVIAKNSGKVHIDNLYVDIKTQPNRWYFFCFPFDINPGDATFNGSYVWYLYDGEARAQNGNGGWKKVAADGVMKSGNGYIFQGAVNGTLTIHVKDITIDTDDSSTNMITYQSDNKNDASWNLIGNSNFAYYDMDNLGYDAPITVYNNSTGNYDAVRPGDDDYEFYPFQAFFVQKPESTESMNFNNAHKETKNKSDENKAKKAAARAKSPKKVNPMRKVINLELASVDADAEATATAADRTRIVVNPTKSASYETDCDAAKFIADNMPQIYSLDNEGAMYSINERPVGNGIINIAVKAPKDGVFTISAARLDCAAKLRDLETGTEVDLAEGGYTFAAEAGTFTNRFQLILADGATAITTPEEAKAAISVEAGAISVNDANADVKIYSVGGALVGSQKGAGSINVPAGAYVVKVNGQSVKVTVNE